MGTVMEIASHIENAERLPLGSTAADGGEERESGREEEQLAAGGRDFQPNRKRDGLRGRGLYGDGGVMGAGGQR